MKKILVVGSQERVDEFQKLKINNAEVKYLGMDDENIVIEDFDLIFDLNLDDNPENFSEYNQYPNLIVIGCAVKESLAGIVFVNEEPVVCTAFGMNALPTFIDRPVMELSCLDDEQAEVLQEIMDEIGVSCRIVQDRVGMVTPRILTMIINEAYFVVGEGTADKEGVNQAMKLGTAYPHGPFEWAEMIGIDNVYETLEALSEDTHDSKYKIAPALKRAYLLQEADL